MPSHDRSIIIFDVETTGLRPDFDQIIELSIQRGLDFDASRWTKRFKPEAQISHGAQERHGIRMEDLTDCTSFSEHAPEIHGMFEAAQIIVGYNVRFDLEILQQELTRAKSPLDLTGKIVIDVYRIWQACEPRSLADAVQRFLGQKHEVAHSAAGDVAATAQVLTRMLDVFGLSNLSWDGIAEILPPVERFWIGPSYHLQWHDDQPIFAFGKHKGAFVLNVVDNDPSYIAWIREKDDFPDHIKQICKVLNWVDSKEEFLTWLKQYSPLPGVKGEERSAMKRRAQEQLARWEANERRKAEDRIRKMFAI